MGLGEHRTDIDGAAYLPATLGDFVWNDINKNGIQDAGEPGLPGVVVELYTQSNTLVGRDTTIHRDHRFGGLETKIVILTIPEFLMVLNLLLKMSESEF